MKHSTKRMTMLAIGAIGSLVATTSVGTAPSLSHATAMKTGKVEVAPVTLQQPVLLAEQLESPWVCSMVGEEWSDAIYFDTDSFHINICRHKQDQSRLLYVHHTKGQFAAEGVPSYTTLPATRTPKGNYIAESGQDSYAVSPTEFEISHNNKVTVREPVIDHKSK